MNLSEVFDFKKEIRKNVVSIKFYIISLIALSATYGALSYKYSNMFDKSEVKIKKVTKKNKTLDATPYEDISYEGKIKDLLRKNEIELEGIYEDGKIIINIKKGNNLDVLKKIFKLDNSNPLKLANDGSPPHAKKTYIIPELVWKNACKQN